jgi:hypothetical protein
VADLAFKAFAGIRNTLPPERLEPADLVAADNIDLDDSGRASRRAGQTLKVSGAAHSLWSEHGLCLLVQSGALKRLNPDYTTATLAAGLSADAVSYLSVNGRVYWSNGTQSGVIADGVNRNWGLPTPIYPPMATPIFGNLTAGTYQYAMTTLRDDGQESGTGLAGTINLDDNAGLRFTWDESAPDVAEVALYVSEPNGMVLYQAAIVATSGSYDFTGGQLALPLDTQWLDKPPAGQCLAFYKGRIYIAQGAFIYATTALGYEHVDLRDYLAVDGAKITLLGPLESGLLVGTETGLYFLFGNALSEFVIVPRSQAGVIPRSLLLQDGQQVTGKAEYAGRNVALFATTEGICIALPDGSVQNLTSNRYQFTPAGVGAAVLRNDATLTQYLLFLQA